MSEQIVNTYPMSSLLILGIALAASMAIATLLGLPFLNGASNDDGDTDMEFTLWVFWTIMCIGTPVIYFNFTEDRHVQDLFYQHLPDECVAAATGEDAQRRIECTVSISRDFVIIDGQFMPIDGTESGEGEVRESAE